MLFCCVYGYKYRQISNNLINVVSLCSLCDLGPMSAREVWMLSFWSTQTPSTAICGRNKNAMVCMPLWAGIVRKLPTFQRTV